MGKSKEETAAYQRAYRKSNREKLARQAQERYQKNRDEILAQRKQYQSDCPELHMLKRVRIRARERGMDFDLELSDITIPAVCPYLGIPLVHGTQGFEPNAPSMDRIDNSFGYIKGNVRVISYLANSMKRNATEEQLLAFRDGITRLHGA